MKKFIFALLLLSCGTSNIQKEYTTSTVYNLNFTLELVDSILLAELIADVDSIAIKSSTGYIYEYYYLKDSLVIRFIKDGDSINVTKRINK